MLCRLSCYKYKLRHRHIFWLFVIVSNSMYNNWKSVIFQRCIWHGPYDTIPRRDERVFWRLTNHQALQLSAVTATSSPDETGDDDADDSLRHSTFDTGDTWQWWLWCFCTYRDVYSRLELHKLLAAAVCLSSWFVSCESHDMAADTTWKVDMESRVIKL